MKEAKLQIVAITGPIGAGKSTVGKILEKLGEVVFDADLLVTEIYDNDHEALSLIKNIFPECVSPENILDRKKLASIIFSDKEKRKVLEEIIHPRVRKLLAEKTSKERNRDFIYYLVPLLFENPTLAKEFKIKILVSAAQDACINRVMKRSALSKEEAQARINSQMPLTEKIKLADYIIDNNSSLADLKSKVSQLNNELKSKLRTSI